MNLENKVLSDIVGQPCPICKIDRLYRTEQGAKRGAKKPCRSCANSISAGGGGSVKDRGCFSCSNPQIYANSLCKDCHNSRSRKYHKEVYRWSKYGLDGPVEMKCCEICGVEDDLVIDHCHTLGTFRGVLCRQCNSALGLLGESKEIINKAFEYAKRTFNE